MIPATVSPTLPDVYTALCSFIQSIVGTDVELAQGLGNRVSMPQGPFIAVTAVSQSRLQTNIDTDFDGFYSDPQTPGTTSSDASMQLDIQIDCYGPNSHDWATMISTLMRDPYGCTALAPVCQPLYADDATMIPLITAEDQYLERWMLNAAIAYDPVTVTAQSFFATLDAVAILVDARFPPGA